VEIIHGPSYQPEKPSPLSAEGEKGHNSANNTFFNKSLLTDVTAQTTPSQREVIGGRDSSSIAKNNPNSLGLNKANIRPVPPKNPPSSRSRSLLETSFHSVRSLRESSEDDSTMEIDAQLEGYESGLISGMTSKETRESPNRFSPISADGKSSVETIPSVCFSKPIEEEVALHKGAYFSGKATYEGALTLGYNEQEALQLSWFAASRVVDIGLKMIAVANKATHVGDSSEKIGKAIKQVSFFPAEKELLSKMPEAYKACRFGTKEALQANLPAIVIPAITRAIYDAMSAGINSYTPEEVLQERGLQNHESHEIYTQSAALNRQAVKTAQIVYGAIEDKKEARLQGWLGAATTVYDALQKNEGSSV